MQLEPCPACKRHVRTDETTCPFCAADIGAAMSRAPRRLSPGQRLGRAALMSFGLSASAALAGCDDDAVEVPIYGAPVQPEDGGGIDGGDAGGAVAIYGAPPQDARVPDASSSDASVPVDAAVDAGVDAGQDSGEPVVVPLYGGAPVPIYGAPGQTPKP